MIQTVTMQAQAGLTGHSIVLRSRDDGTEVDSQPATEVADGVYVALFIDVPAGTYFVQLVSAAGAIVRYSDVSLTLDAEVFPVAGAGGGGPVDLDQIKGPGWDENTDTLEKIRDAIASFSTTTIVIPTPISEVIGMPETLEIGDSYDDETPIKLYVRDDADDPVTVFSGHDLGDLDFAPTFVIAPTPGSSRGRVVGEVTYVPASGPDEGYLKVEIPSLQSRRAVEGESSVQCILKWDGYEKTLLSTTVRWLPRI